MSNESASYTQLINVSLWKAANWCATTFQFHKTSECPPVMGLVFENIEKGREIFAEWVSRFGHVDLFEEIRISIIEGTLPGQPPGYAVHICPDPVGIAAKATSDDIVLEQNMSYLGRMNWMYPIAGFLPLLPRFKVEYQRHKEFLLAPVTQRDGKMWMDVNFGIIKTAVEFRNVNDIGQDDIDAVVLQLPSF
jgi:hypothetical protein